MAPGQRVRLHTGGTTAMSMKRAQRNAQPYPMSGRSAFVHIENCSAAGCQILYSFFVSPPFLFTHITYVFYMNITGQLPFVKRKLTMAGKLAKPPSHNDICPVRKPLFVEKRGCIS